MKIKMFMELTGLSRKTATWLHDNIFHPGKKKSKHRYFTEDDYHWVTSHMYGFFLLKDNVRITKIPIGKYYYITDDGRVFNFSRGFLEEMKLDLNSRNGYYYIGLSDDSIGRKNYRVARLVAQAYVDNPDNKPIVNHLNGIKTENHYTNLEWATLSENGKHAFKMGLSHNDSSYNDSQSICIECFKDGEFVCEYGSIGDAARKLNLHKASISKSVKTNGHYRAGEYTFKRHL